MTSFPNNSTQNTENTHAQRTENSTSLLEQLNNGQPAPPINAPSNSAPPGHGQANSARFYQREV